MTYPSTQLLISLRQTLSHGLITVLAVAIAFALPSAANYILYEWWPLVERDANLLLASEVCLASLLARLSLRTDKKSSAFSEI